MNVLRKTVVIAVSQDPRQVDAPVVTFGEFDTDGYPVSIAFDAGDAVNTLVIYDGVGGAKDWVVLTTGFADNPYTSIKVAPSGAVVAQSFSDGCANPAIVQEPAPAAP